MAEPKILYRSVSFPELIEIFRTGSITGGGNSFNPLDGRSDVFFADVIDDRLIRQGEYVDRQVLYSLKDHEMSRRSSVAQAQIERQANHILAAMDSDGIRYPRDDVPYFQLGQERRRYRAAAFRHPRANRQKYAQLFRDLTVLVREATAIEDQYDKMLMERCAERAQWLDGLPFSSAIVVTRPLSGGIVYSAEHGWCGHGEREYGFRPGQVTLNDVAEVILVKKQRQIGACSVNDLATQLIADGLLPRTSHLVAV